MTKDIKEKTFDELTTEDMKEIKIEFAPGCFDNFDGTQEELDELMAEIQRVFASGEALEKSRPLDLDDLSDEDMEILAKFAEQEQRGNGRTLQ